MTRSDGAQLLALGCYTSNQSGSGTGVGTWWLGASGQPERAYEVAAVSPSCIIWHPRRRMLYATNEADDGTVTAYDVAPDGDLSEVSSAPTGGANPCHLVITPDCRTAVITNYTGGSVVSLALDPDTGAITRRVSLHSHQGSGPRTDRQESAHPHMAVLTPDGGHVQIVDLGTDELRRYRLTGAGGLDPAGVTELPAGTGPRQLHYAQDGRTAYVVGELCNELLKLAVSPDGSLSVTAAVPATTSSVPNLPAHLLLSADGRFCYLSNRGADTLALFDLAADSPVLVEEVAAGGSWPRQFAVTGSRLLCACQQSDLISLFEVRTGTGRLVAAGRTTAGSPTWIAPD